MQAAVHSTSTTCKNQSTYGQEKTLPADSTYTKAAVPLMLVHVQGCSLLPVPMGQTAPELPRSSIPPLPSCTIIVLGRRGRAMTCPSVPRHDTVQLHAASHSPHGTAVPLHCVHHDTKHNRHWTWPEEDGTSRHLICTPT